MSFCFFVLLSLRNTNIELFCYTQNIKTKKLEELDFKQKQERLKF